MDLDGRRWFYKNIYDENGSLINRDVQWVNPNADGTYTSPGEGWVEFIPTSQRPKLFTCTNGTWGACNRVAELGENSDGSPSVELLWTGRLENKPEHIIGAVGLAQSILNVVRGAAQSFVAWRAARQAETTVDDILANAAKSKVSKSIQYTKSGGVNQANKDFDALVGQGGNVINRGGGLRTATLKDGTKVNVRPFSSGGKPTLEIQPPTGKVVKIRYD